MELFNKGRCCVGQYCQFPFLLLCKDSTCDKCGKIVHYVCARHVWNCDAGPEEKSDIQTCFLCDRTPVPAPVPAPSPTVNPPVSQSNCEPVLTVSPTSFNVGSSIPVQTKPCPSCGLFTHKHKGNKLCRFFQPKKKKIAIPITNNETNKTSTTTKIISSNNISDPSRSTMPSISPEPPINQNQKHDAAMSLISLQNINNTIGGPLDGAMVTIRGSTSNCESSLSASSASPSLQNNNEPSSCSNHPPAESLIPTQLPQQLPPEILYAIDPNH